MREWEEAHVKRLHKRLALARIQLKRNWKEPVGSQKQSLITGTLFYLKYRLVLAVGWIIVFNP